MKKHIAFISLAALCFLICFHPGFCAHTSTLQTDPPKETVKERWHYYRQHIKRPPKRLMTLDEQIMQAAYFNYREKAVIYMDKRILKLRGGHICPPIYTDQPYSQKLDFSSTYFRYFSHSFEQMRDVIRVVKQPQFFLVPLLKFVTQLYNAAKKSAGLRAIYPGKIRRRKIPEAELEALTNRWKETRARVHKRTVTVDCSHILQGVIPIIDRGFAIAQQLNGQPARSYISARILKSMIGLVDELIRIDAKIPLE